MEFILLFFVSLLATIIIMPLFIKWVRGRNIKQSIREDSPETHQKKSGTPTMGGAVILLVLLIGSFIFIDMDPEVQLLLLLTAGTGLIGFVDDFIKVVMKRNLGLTSLQKFLMQLVVSAAFLYLATKQGLSTTLAIPGLSEPIELSWFYYVFAMFLVLGTTNATNLTDGLDGLLSGTAIVAVAAFAVIAHYMGMEQLVGISIILLGSMVGFLLFNKNPAKIFMGDTGSLAIGGFLAGAALLLKAEILLAIIGGVFVLETLSVIVQVLWFKVTGKRVLKMSPLHHHYEMVGHSETKVVYGFWTAGLVFSVIGLMLFFM